MLYTFASKVTKSGANFWYIEIKKEEIYGILLSEEKKSSNKSNISKRYVEVEWDNSNRGKLYVSIH